MQRGHAPLVARVHVGARPQQQLHGGSAALRDRVVQRRPAVAVGQILVGPALEQNAHRLHVARLCCPVERRHELAVLRVDALDSALEQLPQSAQVVRLDGRNQLRLCVAVRQTANERLDTHVVEDALQDPFLRVQ
eukprot:354773-Chlamydomonas_euryale.AAC.1